MKHNSFSLRKQDKECMEPIDKLNHIINRMELIKEKRY